MKDEQKSHFYLGLWILVLIMVGGVIGFVTKSEVNTWYSGLNRAPLTPPNYIFPITWTLLYGLIGACGWLLWVRMPLLNAQLLKILYVTQLILNWSWTPLFFRYHLTGVALLVLGMMDVLVSIIIYLAYPKLKAMSLMMLPYLLWIVFATYLNFYIWWHN
jgi:benzodiazapine receptor